MCLEYSDTIWLVLYIYEGFLNISENCGSNIFNCTAWTGLNDLDIEGRYIWDHSNASLTLTNWHPKEPSLSKPEQALNRDCIDILRGGGLNDRPCTHLNWVICEKQFWHWFIDWIVFSAVSAICFCFVYLEFIVPLENFSLLWRRHHCQWRAAHFDPHARWTLYLYATAAVCLYGNLFLMLKNLI